MLNTGVGISLQLAQTTLVAFFNQTITLLGPPILEQVKLADSP